MNGKFFKKTGLLWDINHNMNDGFRLSGARTPQCANILSRHHKRYIDDDKQHKYYVHGILRTDKDGKFLGYGWTQKTKKMVY